MKKTAFIFPGQGSQAIGMGKDLYDNFETARKIYDKADAIFKNSDKKLSEICFSGPEESLKDTLNAQSAIVVTSIAALEVFKEIFPDINPTCALGHSLGEYCAMYTARVMDFDTTVKSIQKRSEFMARAASVTKGTMAAVIGANKEDIESAINTASAFGLIQIANYNEPAQVVLTGETEAIQTACLSLKEKGVRKVVPLSVSGAFHSALMKSAANDFAAYIQGVELNDATLPVITNVDAEETLKAEDFRAKMPKQIENSVRWYQSIEVALKNGVDTFFEFGEGRVLAGLNRKISPEIKTYNVRNTADLEAIKKELIIEVK